MGQGKEKGEKDADLGLAEKVPKLILGAIQLAK